MMMRLSLALLLVASASGTLMFPRSGCGCLRNPVAAELKGEEISQLRGYVQQRGVKHYQVLSDYALQAIFRFNLINNFPDVVPSTRSGVLQVISESLNQLTDKVVPSETRCGQIAGYLQKSVPELASGSVNIDLRSLVASASVVLHQRGVIVSLGQLNILLKTGLSGYLQSSAYQSSFSSLVQLIATLDHIDHNLPNILNQDSLIIVRRALEKRFNLDREIFDQRYKLAIKAFEANRGRILASFNTLAYRGPKYEVTIQVVIKEIVRIFPGIQRRTLRSVLNILQLTNSGGGKATPNDLLAMITIPKLDVSLRTISDVYANRIVLKLPKHHELTIVQIREAYTLFIIGLASQGIQPLQLQATYEAFIWHSQRFFLGTRVYTVEAYILYVIRVVVPSIPRGSSAFRLHIFDSSVVINNILVPEPLTSIYKEGRDTIIARIRGLQGSSEDITKRLIRGEGEKPNVENIVVFKPDIIAGPLPTYGKFKYQNVALSAVNLQQIANVLVQRFNQLKQPSLQLPLLRILVRANVIPSSGDRAAAAFRRLFSGLPQFVVPSNLDVIVTQLSEYRLQLTRTQLLAGLQQFFVASRCLGYVIPAKSLPSVFTYTIREYLQTLTSIPAQPFNDKFLEYLYLRLAIIIRQVTVVDHQVPIDDYLAQKIFSVFNIHINIQVQRTIISFIHSSKLLPKPVKGVSVVSQYQNVLKSLFARYPIGTFILSVRELTIIKAELSKAGISIKISYLRQANIMAYVGMGLLNRFQPSMTLIDVRLFVYRSVRYFLRMNKMTNIASVQFLRVLLHQYKVPIPKLPVPHRPVIQTPVYVQPPIYILSGISLPLKQVQQLVVILRARFVFVSLDNVKAIMAHTILILRADGQKIVQRNCYRYLMNYYSSLPKNIAIGEFDLKYLLKKIDAQLKDTTISSTGIQSAMVELYIHMYYLKLPIPSVKVRNDFLSFVISAYGKIRVRRQLPFGKLFYNFLKSFLPKLPGYLKPFPLFAGPQIYSMFNAKLKAPIYTADIHLYIQVIRRLRKGDLTLGKLQNVISSVRLAPALNSAELTGLIDFAKEKKIRVTQVQLIRAFAICRLSVGLSSVKISRVQLISIFKSVMYNTVQRYGNLLVVSYVEQIIVRVRKYRAPVISLPKPKPFPCHRGSKFFGC